MYGQRVVIDVLADEALGSALPLYGTVRAPFRGVGTCPAVDDQGQRWLTPAGVMTARAINWAPRTPAFAPGDEMLLGAKWWRAQEAEVVAGKVASWSSGGLSLAQAVDANRPEYVAQDPVFAGNPSVRFRASASTVLTSGDAVDSILNGQNRFYSCVVMSVVSFVGAGTGVQQGAVIRANDGAWFVCAPSSAATYSGCNDGAPRQVGLVQSVAVAIVYEALQDGGAMAIRINGGNWSRVATAGPSIRTGLVQMGRGATSFLDAKVAEAFVVGGAGVDLARTGSFLRYAMMRYGLSFPVIPNDPRANFADGGPQTLLYANRSVPNVAASAFFFLAGTAANASPQGANLYYAAGPVQQLRMWTKTTNLGTLTTPSSDGIGAAERAGTMVRGFDNGVPTAPLTNAAIRREVTENGMCLFARPDGVLPFGGQTRSLRLLAGSLTAAQHVDAASRLPNERTRRRRVPIWCVGDQLTSATYSWRKGLFEAAQLGGVVVPQFVGANAGGAGMAPGNRSHGGQSGATFGTYDVAAEAVRAQSAVNSQAIVWLGTNDVAAGATPTGALATLSAELVRYGWSRIAAITLPPQLDDAANGRALAFNAAIRSGAVGQVKVIDAGPLVRRYEMDGLVPLPAAAERVGEYVAEQLGYRAPRKRFLPHQFFDDWLDAQDLDANGATWRGGRTTLALQAGSATRVRVGLGYGAQLTNAWFQASGPSLPWSGWSAGGCVVVIGQATGAGTVGLVSTSSSDTAPGVRLEAALTSERLDMTVGGNAARFALARSDAGALVSGRLGAWIGYCDATSAAVHASRTAPNPGVPTLAEYNPATPSALTVGALPNGTNIMASGVICGVGYLSRFPTSDEIRRLLTWSNATYGTCWLA